MTVHTALPLLTLVAHMRSGALSPEVLYQSYVSNMAKAKVLNAYMPHAAIPDVRLRAPDSASAGLLYGIPLAVKDNFCTMGVPTTAGSHMLEHFVPPYESTVTQRLWDAGAVLLGKTTMDEFAMGNSTTHTPYGPARNPWRGSDGRAGDYPYVAGGSSGGSAVAVAAQLCAAAIGSDTGGSVRQPAAYTGIVAMKPTYGTCSRYGLIAYASSLDQAGTMTRSVADSALLLSVMAGYDPKDSTMIPNTSFDFTSNLKDGVRGLRIGMIREALTDGLDADIRHAWLTTVDWLRKAGATVVEITLPTLPLALPAYYVIALSEMASNMSRYDGVRYTSRAKDTFDSLDDLYVKTRSQYFGREVIQRIMVGTYATSVAGYEDYYLKASKVRRLITNDMNDAFSRVDALLLPTTPTVAFKITDAGQRDPLVDYLNDIYTVPANLTGVPAISVPVGLNSHGLPIGMQVMTNRGRDGLALRVAYAIEQAASFTAVPDFIRDGLREG